MITRPNKDVYFMMLAIMASTRGTCCRRKVGCVFVDNNKFILSTGYNGVPSGEPHCIDQPCPGVKSPSGTNLAGCRANNNHAEDNALSQCPNIFKIESLYVTSSPCRTCIEKLDRTSCKHIYFNEAYAHKDAEAFWLSKPGRTWNLLDGFDFLKMTLVMEDWL